MLVFAHKPLYIEEESILQYTSIYNGSSSLFKILIPKIPFTDFINMYLFKIIGVLSQAISGVACFT